MKCTIESIHNVELSGNRAGARVEGFIPFDRMHLIPNHIDHWIHHYEGVKTVQYENGIFVAAWAETVCSERDKYDAKTGEHIAESKAKAKIYRFIRNFTAKMAEYFESLTDEFDDVRLKYQHCVEHEEEHMEILGNRNND